MKLSRLVVYALVLTAAGYLFYRALPDRSAPATARSSRSGAQPAPARRAAPPSGAWEPAGAEPSGTLGSVAGRVRDADDGAPIPEATLACVAEHGRALATTDRDGRYTLNVPPGRYRVTLAAAGFFAPANMPELLVEEGARASDVDFALHRGARINGRVVDGHARPIGRVEVAVHSARGVRRFATAARPVLTDARGRFVVEVPPAQIVLRAEAPGLGVALSREVYVRGGDDVSGVEIALGTGLSLSGEVIGPERQRVRAALVFLSDEAGTRTIACDEEGRFTTASLAPGRKVLQATAPRYSPSRPAGVVVSDGASNKIVLTLAAPQRLSGRVVDAQEQPVAGAAVSANAGAPGRGSAQPAPERTTKTDGAGAFDFEGVPDLPLTVSARGPGNTSATRTGVAPGTRDLLLRLQSTGGIVGRVTDGRTGAPVTRFVVSARTPGLAATTIRAVSASGEYHVTDLVPGRYQVSFSAPGYGPASLPRVDVVGGSDVSAFGVLDAGGRIAGAVVDGQGRAVPGATVTMEAGWADEPVVTGSSGTFRLENVARGRRSLSVSHPDYDTRILPGVSVFPGQTATVRVDLQRHGGGGPGLRFTGIGAVLSQRDGGVIVVSVLPRSPALVAGLLAGDRIERIDGRETQGLPFAEVVEAIRGIAGTPVRLRIQRASGGFEIDVIREDVAVPRS